MNTTENEYKNMSADQLRMVLRRKDTFIKIIQKNQPIALMEKILDLENQIEEQYDIIVKYQKWFKEHEYLIKEKV